ncbi:MAG: GNAT family N-acetyltransferase [Crocinitomicaceae bacterium]|nr:GNAT family N-acetyltransferase [Crocinitomicaceae bacterium]
MGHLFRSLALAEYLNQKFKIVFLVSADTDSNVLPAEYTFIKIPAEILINQESTFFTHHFKSSDIIVVLDGYQFDEDYVKSLNALYKLVYIDDVHAFKIAADLIINHSGGISHHTIKSKPLTRICLGPDYAILRKAFLENKPKTAFEFDVLICFGGADPGNETMNCLQHFQPETRVAIVVGTAYKFKSELEKKASANHRVFAGLTAAELAELMRRSANAVMSASTVSYEYLAVSEGQLYILQTADNQKYLFQFLIESNAAKPFIGKFTSEWASTKIIDKHSPDRLVKEFDLIARELELTIRRTNLSDLDIVYNWINDPLVRNQSYSTAAVSMSNHTNWFNSKINSSQTSYYILEFKGERMGQIRFEHTGNSALINYLIAPEFRQKGWGSVLLKKGILEMLRENPKVKEISGYVKLGNAASRNSFIRCNFKEEKTTDFPDSVLYTLKV